MTLQPSQLYHIEHACLSMFVTIVKTSQTFEMIDLGRLSQIQQQSSFMMQLEYIRCYKDSYGHMEKDYDNDQSHISITYKIMKMISPLSGYSLCIYFKRSVSSDEPIPATDD